MKLKLVSKVNKTATRGNFTLPKGTYYIGDPGYIFDDKFYNNVLLKHAQEAIKNKKSSYVIPNSGNPLAFISSTLDGDGRYPSNHGFWFSVDSGQIACVNSTSMGLRTEDQLKYYFNRNAIYQTEFDNNFECIGVDRYSENRFFRQEDKGIITMGDLKIQTDSRAWEDEEDYRNYKFPDDSRF